MSESYNNKAIEIMLEYNVVDQNTVDKLDDLGKI